MSKWFVRIELINILFYTNRILAQFNDFAVNSVDL